MYAVCQSNQWTRNTVNKGVAATMPLHTSPYWKAYLGAEFMVASFMSEAWCFMMASGTSSNVQSAQVCASLIIDVSLKSLFTCGGWYETCPIRCLVNSFTEYAHGIHSTIINHHSSPLDRGWVKTHVLIVSYLGDGHCGHPCATYFVFTVRHQGFLNP